MEEFIANVQVLLGVLGHRVLEPYAQRFRVAEATQSVPQLEVTGSTTTTDSSHQSNEFRLSVAGITATAVRTNEGIVVLAGSHVTRNPAGSLSTGYRLIREQLISSQVIHEENGMLKFSKDQLFPSPSQAAGIIVGYSINGRHTWRDDKQRTWAEVEMLSNLESAEGSSQRAPEIVQQTTNSR